MGIGTFNEAITCTPEEKLFDVIQKFAKYSISAVPVINKEGVVTNVYSRTDVMYITKNFDLDQTVEEALKTRPKVFFINFLTIDSNLYMCENGNF